MKRVVWAFTSAILGLVVSWKSALLANRVADGLSWQILARDGKRCWDIEHCHLPWWGYALIAGSIFGPACVWGFVGTRLAPSAKFTRVIASVLALAMATILFYLIVYALM